MSIFKQLSHLLGVPERACEDAIKSEPLARAVLSRRQALGGLAALATGRAFGFPTQGIAQSTIYLTRDSVIGGWHFEIIESAVFNKEALRHLHSLNVTQQMVD